MTAPPEETPDDTIAEREGITPATEAAERVEEEVTATADRMPTPEEEEAAERHGPLDRSVTEHEQEMQDRGAHVEGEGRI